MKKYIKASVGFGMLLGFAVSVSCKSEKKGCTGCCDEPGKELIIQVPGSQEKIVLTFYNAFTPTNFAYCEFDRSGTKIDETCRPNADTVFNDDLNNDFAVTNIEKLNALQIFRTEFVVTLPNDTTPIWQHDRRKNYGTSGVRFTGREYLRDAPNGRNQIEYPFASGLYRYKFMVYDTLRDTIKLNLLPIPSEDTMYADILIEDLDLHLLLLTMEGDIDEYDRLIDLKAAYDLKLLQYEDAWTYDITETEYAKDSVIGKFCIIRNDRDCPIRACVGKDDGDKLLK
jgi:hypothetical protein